jgi:hypothetical protein
MRFILFQDYGGVESECEAMTEWDPADVQAHIDFQITLNQLLTERGELVDAQGLASPDQSKSVVVDAEGATVIVDGPYPETKELVAGYRIVDVDSLERAIEIAAQASAAPAQGGVPIRQRIEVREIMAMPESDV